MQTRLPSALRETPAGREAERILRACVHCGFCNATCPTYQLLGDELDGPRGRIYQIKQLLEEGVASAATRTHLDRCLTCRSCETTCPSGVDYHHLLDIGRAAVLRRVPRPAAERLRRAALRRFLLSPRLFGGAVRLGRALRPLLPGALARRLPAPARAPRLPAPRHQRRMLLLTGCVQPALAPDIDAATVRVFDRLGIGLQPVTGCCGALEQHLDAPDAALDRMRRNIDAWWPAITAGAEAIVVTASGCGAHLKDYGHHLRDDPAYAERAARVAALARDPAEVLAGEDLGPFRRTDAPPVAFHAPCSLQHGQRLTGVVEDILTRLGHPLLPVADAHLCCGAAGTYAFFQPDIATRLRDAKLARLQAGGPTCIATANLGCQLHLAAASDVPVVHWITLLADAIIDAPSTTRSTP